MSNEINKIIDDIYTGFDGDEEVGRLFRISIPKIKAELAKHEEKQKETQTLIQKQREIIQELSEDSKMLDWIEQTGVTIQKVTCVKRHWFSVNVDYENYKADNIRDLIKKAMKETK